MSTEFVGVKPDFSDDGKDESTWFTKSFGCDCCTESTCVSPAEALIALGEKAARLQGELDRVLEVKKALENDPNFKLPDWESV